MKLIDGKVAIVTGSGRGIGRAVAELFARHGARVVINDLDPKVAEEAAQAVHKAGGEALVCAGSVTDAEFPNRLIKTTVDRFKALDIIVNNAGYTYDGVIHKMSDEQWYAMIDCHLTGPSASCAPRRSTGAIGRSRKRKTGGASSVAWSTRRRRRASPATPGRSTTRPARWASSA